MWINFNIHHFFRVDLRLNVKKTSTYFVVWRGMNGVHSIDWRIFKWKNSFCFDENHSKNEKQCVIHKIDSGCPIEKVCYCYFILFCFDDYVFFFINFNQIN